jgi:SAM-dependent methyltransferase
VLDIGVGGGVFESFAIQRGLEIHCLDPSERSIRSIQRRHGLGEKAKVGYSQDIPFTSNTFDYVVMSEVLEHLSDQVLRDTLVEVHRVLLPGGRFLGSVPSRESLAEQQVVCPCCGDRFHRWGHLQSFSPQRMREMLAPNFVVERIRERPFESFPHLNWKGKIFAAVRLSLSHLGVRSSQDRLWFLARKEEV